MYVSIVPFVPHTTVENKRIVYSDTVLSLTDVGKNLKITTIEGIHDDSLESCLKIIFETNPNVIFNTIQYSRNDKKVYFYTNQEITVKEFEKSKYTEYKPISSCKEILEEVKRLLASNKLKNNDCISLYDVAVLVSQIEYQYSSIKERYETYFDGIMKSKLYSSCRISIYGFDYERKELSIGLTDGDDEYKKITFKKKDGDLYISKSEAFDDKTVFGALGDQLSQLYDEYMFFSDYKKEKNDAITSVNSSFLATVRSYGVTIFTNSPNDSSIKDFEVSFLSYNDKYKYNCNSSAVISAFKGNENEVFKRIFIKISDCPKWSQSTLYQMRQDQLAEEQKKEMKKQKKLELAKKIFSFLQK